MLLKDVVEEIQEKAPNYLSPQSIVRKITQVRDRLLRQSGSGQQQTDTVCTGIDLKDGQALYILPCPVGNITDVDIIWHGNWRRLPYRQFHNDSIKPYYYVQGSMIGLVPTPTEDVAVGLKIFHIPVLPPLSVTDMDGMTGFDPDYGMLLVYGVLREITSGYDDMYQLLLNDYRTANNGYEKYSVNERW
ncbi:phage adaptor protein [Paenibacillus bouchesdurhonensis]|uniref:phage adaptor protein n=1 Tax=Paenibacillus bouchesdurhonensis TaxID=1870990 RepID=UPI000DA5F6F2|nr:hypothetical protein [Paenibacillus bouchesdurhonensis]